MKTKIFMLWVSLLLFTTNMNAQWVVADPSNLAQGIVNTTRQIVQTSSTATNMLNNFKEVQKVYSQGKEYYDALKAVNNLGFLFSDKIDELLENVTVVAIMLIAGGILMLFVDKMFNHPVEGEQEITYKNAFIIGFYQCIAMIPGVSRSMSTIVGGMTRGLSRKNAAEFSFFLAVPTMAAATGWKVFKLITSETGFELLKDNIGILILGNVVAFIVALLAIKFFIGFVTKYGFKVFGWYRIIVGGIILILMFAGHELTV